MEKLSKFIKFIEDKKIKYVPGFENPKLLIFINHNKIKKFVNILGESYFGDEGIECDLRFGYISLDLIEIIDHFVWWKRELLDVLYSKIGNNNIFIFKRWLKNEFIEL